ncbi:MAG: TonB-dependent receptor [Nitrospira sp.]|nr:TonB-dependent receptor [Nitrospira sp.]
MKIRHKKKPARSPAPNLAWLVAAGAMLHYSAAAPEAIWAKEPNQEDPFDRKGAGRSDRWGRDPHNPSRTDDRWRQRDVPPGPSPLNTKHRLLAQLTGDQPKEVEFDILPQPLASALNQFGEQAGVQFAYTTEDVEQLRTGGVSGRRASDEALRLLLVDTGLDYRVTGPNTITLEKKRSPAGAAIAPVIGGAAAGAGAAMSSDASSGDLPPNEKPQKPVKVPEILVKDVRERPSWTTPVDGYKADTSSSVTRSNMAIDEIPTSIGVVTRDVIKDTFSRTQNDALEAVSGVSRRNDRIVRSEGINIRGFEVCGNGSFNGMKANGLPTDCLFAPDWGIVERYEVIKGPASIIGGAANPGGVINRITKTPQRSNFAKVESNIGSYDFYRGLVDVNGVLPINDNVRGRMVFAVEEGGNFVDFTPVRQYTVAPSLAVDLFKGAGKLLLVGTYQKFDGASYPGWPLTSDGKILPVPRTRNFGGGANVGAHTNFTGYNGEVHYDHQFIHGIKLTAKGKYSKSDLTDNNVYSYTIGGIPPSGDSYLNNGLRKIRFDTYAGELFLSKEFSLLGQKHEILAGADHRDMKQDFLFGYSYLPVGGPFVIGNVFDPSTPPVTAAPDSVLAGLASSPARITLKQTGVFGQTVLRPFERLTLVLAGRHDNADSTNRDTSTGIQNDRTDSAWTGRAGATVKVTEWMNLYGGIQQSFAPQPFARTRDNQLLGPETGINYEVGAKFNLLNERLRITTALFRTYRRNVATVDPTDRFFSVGVGEQRHQGAEFDVNGQPIPGLNLNANFTYLDAVITEDNDPALLGSHPVRVPRNYVGRVFATYQLQSGLLQGFGFGGGVYYQGKYELSFPNAISTDPYQRVDALLFYRGNERYDVTVNIRNLLNATYIESPGSINAYNGFGAPITAIASLRIFF